MLDAPFGRFLGDADFLSDPASRLAWPNADLVGGHVVTLEGVDPDLRAPSTED